MILPKKGEITMKKTLVFLTIIYSLCLFDIAHSESKQEQLQRFAKMLQLLNEQPVNEKYSVTYEGYETIQVNVNSTEVRILCRIHMNQSWHDLKRKIIYEIGSSQPRKNRTQIVSTEFQRVDNRLIAKRTYVEYDMQNLAETNMKIILKMKEIEVSLPMELRDNIIVKYRRPDQNDLKTLRKFLGNIPDRWTKDGYIPNDNDSEEVGDIFIRNSLIIPPEGLPYKIEIELKGNQQFWIKDLHSLQFISKEQDEQEKAELKDQLWRESQKEIWRKNKEVGERAAAEQKRQNSQANEDMRRTAEKYQREEQERQNEETRKWGTQFKPFWYTPPN